MQFPSTPEPNLPEVLCLGFDDKVARKVKRIIAVGAGSANLVSVRCCQAVPAAIDRFAAIVIDGRTAVRELSLHAGPGEIDRRCVIVADMVAFRDPSFRTQMLSLPAFPLLLLGDGSPELRHSAEFARILVGEPTVRHLEDPLAVLCGGSQRSVLRQFLVRAEVKTPKILASRLSRSRRTLTRQCAQLGLPNPQKLLRMARVSRALTWIHRYPAGSALAHRVARYGDRDSLGRAGRGVFGIGLNELVAEWGDIAALTARLGHVLASG